MFLVDVDAGDPVNYRTIAGLGLHTLVARALQTPVLNGLKHTADFLFFIAERCLVFNSGCPGGKALVFLSPTGTQYRKARKHNKTIISETFSWSLSPINPFIALLMKITVTKDLIRRQMLMQCPEFLGFLQQKIPLL